jgi:hypothetical protein
MEQKIVEIEPLRSSGRAGWVDGPARRIGQRAMPLEGFSVVLVGGTVIGPAGGPDEGRIEMIDRIVRRLRGIRLAGSLGNLSPEVRVDRPVRVLELADRAPCDVLDDRLQAPAGPATRRTVDRRLLGHGLRRAGGPV